LGGQSAKVRPLLSKKTVVIIIFLHLFSIVCPAVQMQFLIESAKEASKLIIPSRVHFILKAIIILLFYLAHLSEKVVFEVALEI
jgi:hypothetical protein